MIRFSCCRDGSNAVHKMNSVADPQPRLERDLLGTLAVPAPVYYGIHTLRAVENFPISGMPIAIYPELIRALAAVKQAAALANRDRARLWGNPRRQVARPVRGGRHPGRGGDLHQHERERGHRQPRTRNSWSSARRISVSSSSR